MENNDSLIEKATPLEFYLSQNYPNPFREKTVIKYCVAYKTPAKITVSDHYGNMVARLINEEKNPGTYEVEFDISKCHSGESLPDGYYYYRLEAGDFISEKKWLCINKLSRSNGMKSLLQTLFFFLFVTQICFAQWEWQNPLPQGNKLNDVAFDGSFGIAVGDFGTIIRSTDGGLSWAVQESGTTTDLNAIGYNFYSMPIVVGDSGLILQSTDTGISWTKQSSVTLSELNKITFGNCPGYIVGDNGTILITSNGGMNWEIQQSSKPYTLNSVSFVDDNNGWAVGGIDSLIDHSIIINTNDGGASWVPQIHDSTYMLNGVCFTDTANGWAVGWNLLYKTTNGGTTWFSEELTTPYTGLNGVYFIDPNIGIVYGGMANPRAGYHLRIIRTTDGGFTWSEVVFEYHYCLFGLNFIDDNVGIAVSSNGQIYRTTDGGINWDWVSQSVGARSWWSGVCFANLDDGWVVGGTYICKTTNGGTDWAIQKETSAGLNDVSFCDADNGIVVSDEFFLKTTDGGQTWEQLSVNYANAIKMLSPSIATAVGQDGKILRTTNGGTSWTQQTSGTAKSLCGVYFTDVNNGIAVGGGYYGEGPGIILKTTDGGANWAIKLDGNTGTLNDVYFVDENNGWTVGENGIILHTVDGGTTWSQQLSETTEWLGGVSFADANNGWTVGRSGTILQTTNGGIDWVIQTSGTTASLNSVFSIDAQTGWVVGENGTILHTTNGGVSFVEEEQLSEIPTEFLLSQNYPNPFNPSTRIKYSVPQFSQVVVKVYDILGNEIETLVNEEKPVGTYELTWKAANLPSGVYFYQLKAGSFVQTRKMLLLK